MKKVLSMILALIIGVGVYWLFFDVSYNGHCVLAVGADEWKLPLESIRKHQVSNGVIYETVFTGSGRSARIVFKVWEEDGDMHLEMDSPRITINGKNHSPKRTWRSSMYYTDTLTEDWVSVIAPGVQYQNGEYFTISFTLHVDNAKWL